MILVTGASGYLGSHVMQTLAARGLPHVGTSRRIGVDLTDRTATLEYISSMEDVDVIIHCAAIVPKTASEYEDKEDAQDNIRMLRNLSMRERSYRIVFVSSITAAEELPSAYGAGKWVAETQYLRQGDVSVRLPGLFGPPRRSGLIYNATKAFLSGEPFTANPCQNWEAMHVKDAADALVDVAETPTKARVLTIEYPEAVFRQRLREFVADVQRDGV